MALFDDPIVWILIVVALVLLFGANKMPQWVKSLGQARKEFQTLASGQVPDGFLAPPALDPDPLVQAAQKEGIDTTGKTREQISSELAFKLNKK